MKRTIIQILDGLVLVLFATAAVVQYNDPDPVLWMTVYGAGAICCALYLVDRLPILLSGGIATLCSLGALYLLAQILFGPSAFLDETGQAMMGIVEETREMLGFLITASWTGFLTWHTRRSERQSRSPEAAS